MKKIALFTCDIMGTITSHLREEELKEHLEKLINYLEQVRKEKNADEIIFSFSTADDSVDYLFRYVDQIRPFLENTKIVLGNQYMDSGCFDKDRTYIFTIGGINKTNEIGKEIQKYQKDNEIVWVGYADDNTSSYAIAKLIDKFPEVPEIYGFIPGRGMKTSNLVSTDSKYGLEGLLQSVENYLNPEIIKQDEKSALALQIAQEKRDSAEKIRYNESIEKAKLEQIEQQKNQESQKERGKIALFQIPSIIKTDSYDYLYGLGFEINRNLFDQQDVDFIVSIYKRLKMVGENPDYGMYDLVRGEEITKEEIRKVRELKNKYPDVFMGNKDSFNNQGLSYPNHEISEAIDILLFRIYECGYLHKHTQIDIDNTIENSSILALSLALSPHENYKHKPAPHHRYYRICNIHREKTPSLLLYEDTKSFYCFGCGNSGNIFNYLMKVEDLSFPVAIETLAKAFNVVLQTKQKTNERNDIIEKIIKAFQSDYYKELVSISDAKTNKMLLQEPKQLKLTPQRVVQKPIFDEEDLPF